MKKQTLKRAAVAICLLAIVGCERIGGRSIVIDFRSAEGVRGGEAVYFAGIRVGTAGEPRLVNGRAQVPVTIARKHKAALPPGAVFLIKADPTDARKLSLSATACSEGQPGQAPSDLYKGASNRLEFLAMCGAEKAHRLWDEITK